MSVVVEFGRLMAFPERWQKVFCKKCDLQDLKYSMLPIISYLCDGCSKVVVKDKKTR